jgi:hypothetical protein
VAWPAVGLAGTDRKDPKPIPGGTAFLAPLDPRVFHTHFPVFGNEVSTITDFNGSVAAAEIRGGGVGTDLLYDADMRFMSGRYVAINGGTYEAAFGFV